MAKGKSQFCTWFCTLCNMVLGISYYKKQNNDQIMKEKKMFCKSKKCRQHVSAKRKDTKKGSNKK